MKWLGLVRIKMDGWTDLTLKDEKFLFFGVSIFVSLILPYLLTFMWAALVVCALCSGGVMNIWRR